HHEEGVVRVASGQAELWQLQVWVVPFQDDLKPARVRVGGGAGQELPVVANHDPVADERVRQRIVGRRLEGAADGQVPGRGRPGGEADDAARGDFHGRRAVGDAGRTPDSRVVPVPVGDGGGKEIAGFEQLDQQG